MDGQPDNPIALPAERLRRVALAAQGLHARAPFGRGRPGVRRAIEHLGYVQIDAISVVERAHHHVLRTRVPGYRPEHLHQLLERERSVFEYWFHAASFLPMRDLRFALRRMRRVANGEHHFGIRPNPALEQRVVDRVRAEGPLRARDFAEGPRRGTWWDWSPTKRALERLFHTGQLMVTAREGIEKLYDLPERVLPADALLTEPNLTEQARHLVDTHLRAHGVIREPQVTLLRKDAALRTAVRDDLQQRARAGELAAVTTPASASTRWWLRREALDSAPPAARRTALLSPFDPLVIHRERGRVLFGFDYTIECYVPAADRQYGYFCLPILRGQRLIGRVDAAARRDLGRLELRHLHLEPGTRLSDADCRALQAAVGEFAAANDCRELRVLRSCAATPAHLPHALQTAVPGAGVVQ